MSKLVFATVPVPEGEVATNILIITTLLSIFWLLWNMFTSRNPNPPLPPGPRPLPLFGNLLSLDPELHSYFAQVAKKYGPISRVWLGKKLTILITSQDLAREVLKVNEITFANRSVPIAVKVGTYDANDMVSAQYGDQWRMLRRICVHELLSNQILDSVYFIRRKEVRNTVNYFYNHAGTPVDVGEPLFSTAWNMITGMMWGDKERLGAELREVMHEMVGYVAMPNVSDYYPALAPFDLQRIRKKMQRLVNRLDVIFDTVIDQRRKMPMGGQENKDFLQVLLRLIDCGHSDPPFTITNLKALLMDMVVGGTDTYSNAIEFALAELMNQPEILYKAQHELEKVVGIDNIVEESHTNKLPYLTAIMKETLRLHPTLPLLVPHCASESCVIGGYTVPKGAQVFVNAWAIHRDPVIWEKDIIFLKSLALCCRKRLLSLQSRHQDCQTPHSMSDYLVVACYVQ